MMSIFDVNNWLVNLPSYPLATAVKVTVPSFAKETIAYSQHSISGWLSLRLCHTDTTDIC
jgi:hypothetical protein